MGIPAPEGVGASGLPPTGDAANAVVTGVITGVGPTAPFAFRGPMNMAMWGPVATPLTTTAGSLAATVGSNAGLAIGYNINSVNAPLGTTIKTLAANAITLAIPPISLRGRGDGISNNLTIETAVGIPAMATLVGAAVSGPGVPNGAVVNAVIQERVLPTNTSPGTPGIIQLSAGPITLTPFQRASLNFFTFLRTGNAITATGADANATYTGSGANFTGSIQVERSFDGGQTWLVANVGGNGKLAVYSNGTPVNLTFGEPEKNVLYRLNCTALSAGSIAYRMSQTGGAAESLSIQLI